MKLIEIIDYYLDRITMYRLVLYELIFFVGISVIFSLLGYLPFSFTSVIFSTVFLVIISLITNRIFATVFEAPTNTESVYITALILALIISPARSLNEVIFLAWAGFLAMA